MFFKINLVRYYSKTKRAKHLYGGRKKQRKLKIQKQSEYHVIKNINLFNLKKENEAIKDRKIRDIKILLEQQEDYYKPVTLGNFWIEYESNGDRNKNLSIKEYLEEIKSYLKDIVNDIEKSDSWKIQLTTAINFISFKDIDGECVMHSKSDNREVMAYGKVYEVIEELFELHLCRYQIGLETSISSSDFIFDSVYLLYYKCHKTNFKCGGSYIDFPDQIQKQQNNMILTNDDDKCFQYAATVTLNHEEIGRNL